MSYINSNVCELMPLDVSLNTNSIEQVTNEVTKVFRMFVTFYFKSRSPNLLRSIFSEEITNIGSGSDEFAIGLENVMNIFNRDREQCPNSIGLKEKSLCISPLNTHSGIAIAEFDLSTEINNVKVELPDYRITMIVGKEDEDWLIKHLHFSKGETVLKEGESFPLKEISRKAFETKDLFLANISHEIRTPVTGIIGMTEMLKRSELSEEQFGYIEIIKDSSHVLLDIINDLLDISKIEAGKLELREENFSIKDLMSNIRTLFAERACRKNLSLKLSFYSNIQESEAKIRTDKTRIEQILMNLITNALKHTEEGCIEISVASRIINQYKSEFKIAVRDTGIGIAPEDLAKLFKKFGQLDQTYTRKTCGNGLGLYICKELTKLLGGEIGVESEPGVGSNFWFTFIGEHVDIDEHYCIPIKCDYSNLDLGYNVLIVDDKEINIKVIKLMLESVGCNVDVAVNGEESLTAFKPGYHQLVFMDIMMPVMDGITAMKLIRQKHLKVPPIIALTANAMEGDAKTYMEKGFTDYLPKPATLEDLVDMMTKWIIK
jgi:signal transduction histidine kinase/CheY-like chemotaxis protein